ncbi:MAG: 3D domain-containing protein [Chthoniobacterales bacterium]
MKNIFCIAGIVCFSIVTGFAGKNLPTSDHAVFSQIENVRTTAYSVGPQHNGNFGAKNALGQPLRKGEVRSAAADWSRWPVGTLFRVVETGQKYIVDDIGSAMVGTSTIDLFKPTEKGVRKWGARRVTIEILEWGSFEKSLKILSERTSYRHIRKMVQSLKAYDAV